MHDDETTLPLTEMERELFEVLMEHEKAVLAPVQARYARLARHLEARLGLPNSSIGRTHIVDPATWTVVAQERGLEVVK